MKGKRIKIPLTVWLVLILIGNIIPNTPTARADGASSIEDVWIEWVRSTWSGGAATTDDSRTVEFSAQGTFIDDPMNFSRFDVDTIEVYGVRAYIRWLNTNDAFWRDWYFSAWEYDALEDAGALSHTDEMSLQNYDGTGNTWVGITPAPYWNFTADAFYFGVSCETGAGSVYVWQEETAAATDAWIHDRDTFYGDPFVEDWGTANSEYDCIQIRFWGFKQEQTETNIFIGNATHYTARRDLNYTFPANVESEEMSMSFNISETILNITRYNGGAWDTILASSEYETGSLNATHNLLTIPEATINLYDGLYRVYTSTYTSYFSFGGAFYENGTSYGAVNITADTSGGNVIIEVNGSTAYGSDDEVFSFNWDVGEAYRFIFPSSNFGSFNIFFPEEDYATYEFELRDFTGDLYLGANNWISSWRYVNGTNQLIEQILIQDVVNNIPLTLVTYQTYTLLITFYDLSTYEFGFFVSGAIANPVLALTEIAFSSRAQFTYQHVTVEATRTLSTQITINYEDSLNDTDSVTLLIEYRNGTDIYTDTSYSDSVQWNWASANAYTDYLITVTIVHGIFGSMTYQQPIGVGRPFNPFPSLRVIGTFGPIDSGNLLSIFIVSVCALAFSALSAEVGGFVAVAVAAILRYWNVNDFAYTTLGIAGAIVILFALMRRSTK